MKFGSTCTTVKNIERFPHTEKHGIQTEGACLCFQNISESGCPPNCSNNK